MGLESTGGMDVGFNGSNGGVDVHMSQNQQTHLPHCNFFHHDIFVPQGFSNHFLQTREVMVNKKVFVFTSQLKRPSSCRPMFMNVLVKLLKVVAMELFES